MKRLALSLALTSLLLVSSGCGGNLQPQSTSEQNFVEDSTYYSMATIIEKLGSSGIPCETADDIQSLADEVFPAADTSICITESSDGTPTPRVWFTIEVFENSSDLAQAVDASCGVDSGIDSRVVIGENWQITNAPDLTGIENTRIVEAIGGTATRQSDLCSQSQG